MSNPVDLSPSLDMILDHLARKETTAKYMYERRAACITACCLNTCCPMKGFSHTPMDKCLACRAKTVGCCSKGLSGLISLVLGAASCGLYCYFCECKEPKKVTPQSRMVGVVVDDKGTLHFQHGAPPPKQAFQ